MVYSDAARVHFVHVPKTGGTSVEEVFLSGGPTWMQRSCHAKDRFPVYLFLWLYAVSPGFRYLVVLGVALCTLLFGDCSGYYRWTNMTIHTPLAVELAREPDGPWKAYRRFAVVRNPYTRLVSTYHHMQLHRVPWNGYDFARFCHHAQDECREHATRPFDYDRSKTADVMVLPQHVFVCEPHHPGRVIVDRVLRFERLADEWAQLCAEWRLTGGPAHFPTTLPHANASTARGARPQWTPALADMVYTTYRRDFELFGYDRDSWRGEADHGRRAGAGAVRAGV